MVAWAVLSFRLMNYLRARHIDHGGHTRLPRYVQGKRGVVAALHAAYNFPDDVAPGGEEEPPQRLRCPGGNGERSGIRGRAVSS